MTTLTTHPPPPHRSPRPGDGHAMTTTIETGALDKTLRTLKLSGMLETIEARLAQARAGELGHIEFLQVLCEDEITRRAGHGHPPPAAQRPVRRAGHPRRLRLHRITRSCPPRRSATWPPCAGCTPASP